MLPPESIDLPVQDPILVQEPDPLKYHFHIRFDVLRTWYTHHTHLSPTRGKSRIHQTKTCPEIGKGFVAKPNRRTEMNSGFIIYDLRSTVHHAA